MISWHQEWKKIGQRFLWNEHRRSIGSKNIPKFVAVFFLLLFSFDANRSRLRLRATLSFLKIKSWRWREIDCFKFISNEKNESMLCLRRCSCSKYIFVCEMGCGSTKPNQQVDRPNFFSLAEEQNIDFFLFFSKRPSKTGESNANKSVWKTDKIQRTTLRTRKFLRVQSKKKFFI